MTSVCPESNLYYIPSLLLAVILFQCDIIGACSVRIILSNLNGKKRQDSNPDAIK